MNDSTKQPTLIGTVPWLPWPLSVSAWWTRPVRAEPLAAVRIAVCLILLADQWLQYYPCLFDLYGIGSLGSPELFRYRTAAPQWNWSLFYGFSHSLVSALALFGWILLTAIMSYRLRRFRSTPDDAALQTRFRGTLIMWFLLGLLYVLGLWGRENDAAGGTISIWLVPAVMLVVSGIFWNLQRLRPHSQQAWFIVTCVCSLVILVLGGLLASSDSESFHLAVHNLFVGWAARFEIIQIAFFAWVVLTACLLMGFATRPCAIVVWILTVSFTNLNPEFNSKGDAVRSFILFYLMLSPCGAVWSVDRLLLRLRGLRLGPIYILPWPLRLLFIQLVFIYFFTGLFKMFGIDWWTGNSLYYVLSDLVLSRMSFEQWLFIPPVLLRIGTWAVLFWELTFPVWVSLRWARTAALLFGFSMHVGTLVLMEIGGFEWYMFVLYIPLLPWSRLLRDPGYSPQ